MRRTSKEGRFAERVVSGVDDLGVEERIVIWIERKPGGLWAVEGFELEDALERANEALEDDVRVSTDDGRPADAKPFVRSEILGPLERWFFGRR